MGKRDEERDDEEEEEEEDDLRDPFGFLELKDRLQESEEEEGDDAVYVHPIEVERVEEEMERRGAAKLKKNVFGLEEIPKEMEAMWELVSPDVSRVQPSTNAASTAQPTTVLTVFPWCSL